MPRKACFDSATGILEFNLDDDLLSHGETPHYHRRHCVSLLSSEWNQVGPQHYGHQENPVVVFVRLYFSFSILGFLRRL